MLLFLDSAEHCDQDALPPCSESVLTFARVHPTLVPSGKYRNSMVVNNGLVSKHGFGFQGGWDPCCEPIRQRCPKLRFNSTQPSNRWQGGELTDSGPTEPLKVRHVPAKESLSTHQPQATVEFAKFECGLHDCGLLFASSLECHAHHKAAHLFQQ